MSFTAFLRLVLALCVTGGLLAGEPAYSKRAKGAITFNKDIAPIVYKNCASCHRKGEVAPFSLLSYEEVKKHNQQIVDVVERRYMPPWKAEHGFGEFVDERRLSNDQIGMYKQWVDEGAPEGTTAAPPPPKFTEGWQLGPPDLILKMPEKYAVPAEGRDLYRCFVIPIPITEDKYVQAVEFRPANRAVVHHAILFLDSTGGARKKDEEDPQPGYKSMAGPGVLPSGGLGGWAPGAMPKAYPAGVATSLKKGTDLVLQVHFNPTGKPEEEQSEIGLYFATQKPRRTLIPLTLFGKKLDIPAGEKAFKMTDSLTLPVDAEAIGIIPHAHLLAKDMQVTATLPGGQKAPLLWIKDWDFNWQGSYQYKQGVRLPKGTKIDMQYTYDNSDENPNNPNKPAKRVKWGEQTTDEMALLWIQMLPAREEDVMALKMAGGIGSAVLGGFAGGEGVGNPGDLLKDAIKKYDTDGDGKLSPAERAKAMQDLRKQGLGGQGKK